MRCLDLATEVAAGSAGASARREAEVRRRRQAERHHQIKARHPILGRLALLVDPEPDAGRSFALGAKGEERLGGLLDRLAGDGGLVVLHDRRLGRSAANIDHLALTANGVWVIDAKHYSGCVRFSASTRNGQATLRINGRARGPLLAGLDKQVAAVRGVLDRAGHDDAPVHGALCFVDTEIPLLQREVVIEERIVTWPRALKARLLASGEVTLDVRAALQRVLASSFAPR